MNIPSISLLLLVLFRTSTDAYSQGLPLLPWDKSCLQTAMDELHRIFNFPPESLSEMTILTNLHLKHFEEFGFFEVHGNALHVGFNAKAARPVTATDWIALSARSEAQKSGKSSANRPARLKPEEAEALAKTYAKQFGADLDETYQPWDEYHAGTNCYSARQGGWSISWHKHIEGIPVWNMKVLIGINDQSGRLIGFTIFPTLLRDLTPVKPKLSLADAQAIAAKEGQRQADLNGWGKGKMMPYPDIRFHRLYYYIEEDFALGRHTRLKQPRLHLVYAVEVGNYRNGDPKQQFDLKTKVLVDAVTGEIVPQSNWQLGG